MYSSWPHYIYKNADKSVRGQYLDEAEYVATNAEDAAHALADLEAAKALSYAVAADASLAEDVRKAVRHEVVDLATDLATALASRWDAEQLKLAREGQGAVQGPYDAAWPVPIRIKFLYDEVPTFDDSPDGSESFDAQLALAMLWRGRFRQAGEDRPAWAADPADILRKAIASWPKAKRASEAQFALGHLLSERQDFLGAIAEFEKVGSLFPGSRWVSDAKAAIQEIRRPILSLGALPSVAPGARPSIPLHARNVATLRLQAMRLRDQCPDLIGELLETRCPFDIQQPRPGQIDVDDTHQPAGPRTENRNAIGKHHGLVDLVGNE
jgi:hypothetical protein